MAVWDPEAYVRAKHPDVQVVEMDLPMPWQGCVDHEKRIIWLAAGMSEVDRRCTLAFELGQLEQGPAPADPFLARARQLAAEDWAARKLLDLPTVLDGLRVARTLPEIAAVLAVDTPTLRARLRGLSDSEQDAAMEAIHGLSPVV